MKMKSEWKQRMQKTSRKIGAVALAATFAGVPVINATPQAKGGKDTATTDTQGKFYCNIKALTPAERARLKDLGAKMAAARTAAVETEKGYEFQYNPDKISVGEVAEWVVTENKCCSFYDFHIDLEEGGKLICLRLTGSEGVKAFIRSEFHI
jgi:hypothetical protein